MGDGCLARPDRVVVLSESWRPLAAPYVSETRLRVILQPDLPISISMQKRGPPRGQFAFSTWLISSTRKGYPLLVGHSDISRDNESCRLVFAGSGETKEAKELCRELGIERAVEFLGWIREPRRTEELRKAGIFVLPSYQEGLPMGVLGGNGIRVGELLTTPVGGIGDVVSSQNGILSSREMSTNCGRHFPISSITRKSASDWEQRPERMFVHSRPVDRRKRPFLIIIGYAFLTLAISSIFDPTYSTFQAIKTLKNRELDLYLLMFIFAYLLSYRQDFLRLIRVFMAVMFISSFITLIDFLNIPDLGIVGTYRGRIEGPIGAANQYGTLLAFLLPLSIATMPDRRPVARLLWRLGILTFAILLIGTGSRGAFVAIISGSMAAVFYLREYMDLRVVARVAIAGLLTVIVLISAFLVFNPEFLQSLFDKTATGDLESASSGRWAIWGAAFGVMLECTFTPFLVGYGWNTFDTSGILEVRAQRIREPVFRTRRYRAVGFHLPALVDHSNCSGRSLRFSRNGYRTVNS